MRKGFKESPEPGGGAKQKLEKVFAGFALFSTLLLGNVGEGMAQETSTKEREEDGNEIVFQSSAGVQVDTLITLEDTIKLPGIEPYPEGVDEGKGAEGQASEDEEAKPKEKGGIAIHGMLYGGTGVAGDFISTTNFILLVI